MIKTDKLDISSCMQNRELTWLKFNERVLEEANCNGNPLLERLKFISIFNSNLDEFYMVRVGSLIDYMLFAPGYYDNRTGMTAEQQLNAIYNQTTSLYVLKDRYFGTVMGKLAKCGVRHLIMNSLSPSDNKIMERHFLQNILPLLSPQIIDNRHPFPHLDNEHLYVAVILEHKSRLLLGLIAVPHNLDRVFQFSDNSYVLLEDIIYHFSNLAFNPYKVKEKTIIMITRSADINTEEDDVDENFDYRQFMKKLIKKRQRLAPVRLQLQYAMNKDFNAFFCEKLNISEKQIFLSSTPLELSYCFALDEKLSVDIKNKLMYQPHTPSDVFPAAKKVNLMKHIREKDILFSYPFESISPFLEMVRQAAEDPMVLSIKVTLYRIDSQSRIAESLIRAAENGKEVIVLMELRARFDEANNIEWSQRLDEAGCRVIYGPTGFKVHSKVCLITKREFGKINYITQIGTGNYNEKTAKQYTDLSLITTNNEIGKDAAVFFNNLLLGKIDKDYTHLWVAPDCFKQNIIRYIERERDKAKKGERGQIIIKCNSLTDREIIAKLVEASQCGVKISLLVRGICCLIPRVPEFTENIAVISIVGRFLEHSRVYCFGTVDDQQIYISSADLMTRNTERRVEIACPILDHDIKQRIYEMLEIMQLDNTKAWEQFADGRYILRHPPADLEINSQSMFMEQARIIATNTLAQNKQSVQKVNLLTSFSYIGEKIKAFFQNGTA